MTQVHSAQGEDRSSYQPVAPWTADSFGFTKATEGTDWLDPTFAANWASLREEGKPRGAYHFFHPGIDPVAQAKFFLSVVHEHGLKPGDMLVVHSEIAATAAGAAQLSTAHSSQRSSAPLSSASATADTVNSGTRQFLETVRGLAGRHHPLLVYTNLSVGALLNRCTGFELFIAYPADTAPPSVAPWPRWRFWQWGFGGGPGGGDRDAYNGTEAELLAWISSFKTAASTK